MSKLLKPQPTTPDISILDVQQRASAGELRRVPVGQLGRSQFQPRRTVERDESFEVLVDSVKEYGVFHPIVVRELGDGRLELLAGERRLEAAKACGHSTIPARILTNVSDVAAQGIALTENCTRANLSPWEQAKTLRALKELCAKERLDTDVRSLARLVGISKSLAADLITVAERLDARVLTAVEQSGAPLVLERLTKATLVQAARRDDPQARVHALTRALSDKETTVVSAPFVLRGKVTSSLTLRIARPVAALTPEEATSLLEELRPVVAALESAKRK